MECRNKRHEVGRIGTGRVGSSCACSRRQRSVAAGLVLVVTDRARAESALMDPNHSLPFVGPIRFTAADCCRPADADALFSAPASAGARGKLASSCCRKRGSAQTIKDQISQL